jgi:hypothetical protein
MTNCSICDRKVRVIIKDKEKAELFICDECKKYKRSKKIQLKCPWSCNFVARNGLELYNHIVSYPHSGITKKLVQIFVSKIFLESRVNDHFDRMFE